MASSPPSFPAKFNDPIYCELEHACLDEKPAYTALSYVWGDPKVTKPIKLRYYSRSQPPREKHVINATSNAHLVPQVPLEIPKTQENSFEQFQVTTNLAEALRYLRDEVESLTFWIDAVCINQGGLRERSAQVQVMGSFYSLASEVRIWLGPAHRSSPEKSNVTSVEEQVKAADRFLSRAQTTSKELGCPIISIHDNDRSFKIEETEIQGLDFISSRKWWSRIWVLQEAHHGASPRILQCGSTKMAFGPCTNV